MPLDKSRLDRMIKMMDDFLRQREQDKLNYYCDEDDPEDQNTDPVEFLESPAAGQLPIAEPPMMPQEDSTPQRIHGEGRRDLFR